MDIGFGAPVSGAWATPQNLAAFAVGAERGGYQSLWSFQRLLVPAGSGMGVAIVNVPFVSPGYLARQAASVDVLSGGRHRAEQIMQALAPGAA
jgi:alkanesulfonate monooxygenase SsuD/methylene tetrahydromethanopterin reductase-like flavin-dependent oxidoreductase (luciferase family)